MILKVTRTSSHIPTAALATQPLHLTEEVSFGSVLNDQSTTSEINRKLVRFEEEMKSVNTFDFDPLKLAKTMQRANVFTMTVY